MTTENRELDTQSNTPVDDAAVLDPSASTPDASSPAASSSADPGATEDKPKSTLDVIRDVTRKDKADAQPAASPAADDKDGTSQPSDGDKPDEEEKDPPFHTHPRWIKKQAEVVSLRSQVAALEAPARNFQTIQTFMQKENLNTDTVVQSLQAAALFQNDPEKALTHFRAIVADLEEHLGEVLPQDLQDEVDDGLITEARAKELAKARAVKARAEGQVREVTERETTREVGTKTKEAVAVMAKAVAEWEAAEKGKDPSYAKKQPFILKAVQASVAQARAGGKVIFTADEVKEILETAKKETNLALRSIQPPKPEIKAPRSSGHQNPTPRGGSAANGKGTSTLDIVRNRGARTD